MKYFYYYIHLVLSQTTILVGGQAVIEGVMMRVPAAYATAVRDKKGEIHINRIKFHSMCEKNTFFKKPIFRGIINLFESLKIGYSPLEWSSAIIMPEEDEKTNKFVDFFMTCLSIILAVSLFFIAPIGLTTWLFDKEQNAFSFNIISGIFRIIFFLIYLILISFLNDIKTLFQYHGAEHKTIYNFESGKKLSVQNAKLFSTQHPRCGTSFLFIIMIVAMLSFAILDSIYIYYIGELKIWMRLILHIPFIPIVASIGYEVLKITAKYNTNIIFKILSQPGLWLQNITTKEPNDLQIEVAITALNEAFGNKIKNYEGKKFTAQAIQ